MTESNLRKLNENELFFYEDRVCGEADAVYRFCFGVCGEADKAYELVKLAYKKAAEIIGTMMNYSAEQIRAELIKISYTMLSNEKTSKKSGSSLFAKYLSKLSFEQKSIVLAKDVVGLSVKQISQVLGNDELYVRKELAAARIQLPDSFGH